MNRVMIVVRPYVAGKGIDEEKTARIGYWYDDARGILSMTTWVHDSAFWNYSVVMVSTGKYVLLARMKNDNDLTQARHDIHTLYVITDY